jgi:hypothetical protein
MQQIREMEVLMLERDVWRHFKKVWPYHCERQEPALGSGQPDVILLDAAGTSGLVELKRPNKILLRPSQWVWHERWQRGKGRCPVVTCENVRGVVLWKVFWIDARNQILKSATNDWTSAETMVRLVARNLKLEIENG